MKKTVSVILILLCCTSVSFAQKIFGIQNNALFCQKTSLLQTIKTEALPLQNPDFRFIYSQTKPQPRSLLKATLFSGIVPGGGEYYNRSWIRGALFTSLEVVAWVMYKNNRDKGNEIDAEFKAYANEHWREDVYKTWLQNYKDEHNDDIPHHFTHTLPETKTQQYYEMIGKYEQFLIGWDDVTDYEQVSERRYYYMDRRGESNDYLVRASQIAMLTIFNRVLSIIDSAIITKNFNNKIDSDVGIRLINNSSYYCYSLKFVW